MRLLRSRISIPGDCSPGRDPGRRADRESEDVGADLDLITQLMRRDIPDHHPLVLPHGDDGPAVRSCRPRSCPAQASGPFVPTNDRSDRLALRDGAGGRTRVLRCRTSHCTIRPLASEESRWRLIVRLKATDRRPLSMPDQGSFPARLELPEPETAARIAGGEPSAIRADGHAVDRTLPCP